MNEIQTQAKHYVAARLNAEKQAAALDTDPRLAESNASIDNLRQMMAEARARREEVAKELGIHERVEAAKERLATVAAHLESIWMKALEADPKHGKTVTLGTGDQVTISVKKGVQVTDPRALFQELDKRKLWTAAIEKPEKLADALNTKALRPLCDPKAGQDLLPGIKPADKPSLSLRRMKA